MYITKHTHPLVLFLKNWYLQGPSFVHHPCCSLVILPFLRLLKSGGLFCDFAFVPHACFNMMDTMPSVAIVF